MSSFQEDMLFKNVSDEDAKIFVDILGKESKKVKIITRELRLFDPTTFRPDIMLELDDEIMIVELQSVKVRDKHHQRFHIYVAISDYNFDETDKEINLYVFSTAENSKQVEYYVNKLNDFKYEVISLKDYDSEEIINIINYKIENNIEITGRELILFSLVPVIEKSGNVEDYVGYVVDTLINLKGLNYSIKALAFGIEWLIVDKFVKNERERNILRDLLGDKMSLIYEYGKDKEDKGMKRGMERAKEEIIVNQLRSGLDADLISRTSKVPLSQVKAIERKLKFKK